MCFSRNDVFDDILVMIAKRIYGKGLVNDLGKQLGFIVADINRFNDENAQQGGSHMGTLNMLRQWSQWQRRDHVKENLKAAMENAGLIRMADDYLSTYNVEQTNTTTLPWNQTREHENQYEATPEKEARVYSQTQIRMINTEIICMKRELAILEKKVNDKDIETDIDDKNDLLLDLKKSADNILRQLNETRTEFQAQSRALRRAVWHLREIEKNTKEVLTKLEVFANPPKTAKKERDQKEKLEVLANPPKTAKKKRDQNEKLEVVANPPKTTKKKRDQNEKLEVVANPRKTAKKKRDKKEKLEVSANPPKTAKKERDQKEKLVVLANPPKTAKKERDQKEISKCAKLKQILIKKFICACLKHFPCLRNNKPPIKPNTEK